MNNWKNEKYFWKLVEKVVPLLAGEDEDWHPFWHVDTPCWKVGTPSARFWQVFNMSARLLAHWHVGTLFAHWHVGNWARRPLWHAWYTWHAMYYQILSFFFLNDSVHVFNQICSFKWDICFRIILFEITLDKEIAAALAISIVNLAIACSKKNPKKWKAM